MLRMAATGLIAAALAFGMPLAACADPLLTGIVRDTRGAAIDQARVSALDAQGRVLGTDSTQADGTFAIASPAAVARIIVRCRYCETRDFPVHANTPLIAVVRRFAALVSPLPQADDFAVLPERRAGQALELIPFTEAGNGSLSLFGFNAAHSAIAVDGIPFYRGLDGADPGLAIPAGALTAVSTLSPASAPVVGTPASGGVYALSALGEASGLQADAGNAFDLIGRVAGGGAVRATAALGNDGAGDTSFADVGIVQPLAGGTFEATAVDLGTPDVNAAGARLGYATASRRYATDLFLTASRSVTDAGAVAPDGEVTAGMGVRNTGPFGLELRARARFSSGEFDDGADAYSGTTDEEALSLDGSARLGALVVRPALALQRDGTVTAGTRGQDVGTVGAVAADIPLGAAWTAGADGGSAMIPAPIEAAFLGHPVATRASFTDLRLAYADGRRLQFEALAWDEHTAGVGVEGAWEIAPLVSVRAWTATNSVSAAGAGGYGMPLPGAAALTRNSVWFSYDGALRFDVIERAGYLEGDVALPLDARHALIVGSEHVAGGRRTTIGLRVRP